MYSRIIIPPDLIDDSLNARILILNLDQSFLPTLIAHIGREPMSLDIYLYHNDMDNVNWLNEAVKLVDKVVANSVLCISGVEHNNVVNYSNGDELLKHLYI